MNSAERSPQDFSPQDQLILRATRTIGSANDYDLLRASLHFDVFITPTDFVIISEAMVRVGYMNIKYSDDYPFRKYSLTGRGKDAARQIAENTTDPRRDITINVLPPAAE
ncbi:MAG TPA: hypothetical protein VG965_05530 [Patescibacteria group bacterium]|nr:hypothetical protein [Patescibacteria group bacterium]